MTTHRTTRRRNARRVPAVLAAAVVAAGGLLAGSQVSSSAQETPAPALNRMEHEAHRYLITAREEQRRVLNPREHLAHIDVEASGPVAAPATTSVDPCSVRLARAWDDLGHFSDGYESHLLRQPPCAAR